MFFVILKYELKYWLKQPTTYLYALILFTITFGSMTGMAAESSERFGGRVVISAHFIYGMLKRIMMLVLLLLPIIMGMSVYRDFNTQMHSILYSYPFKKKDYVAAKFLSAFSIFVGITLVLWSGFILGVQMPWVNPDLVQSIDIGHYLQVYGLILLPNIFLLASFVFSIVLLSRNIYAGFVAVLLIILVRLFTGTFFNGEEQQILAALLDPLGDRAISYYNHSWTVVEQNTLLLPMGSLVLLNRLLWLSIGGLILAWSYKKFQFHETAIHFFKSPNKTNEQPQLPTVFKQKNRLLEANILTASYDFSFKQQIKNTWTLSQVDFKYILSSKSFIVLVLSGLTFVLIVMSNVNPRWDTETLPMTWQMLELPSMFYAGVINAITFLYAGLLIQRERMVNMDQLVNVNPIPNWVFLGSKLLALIKMQMVLLLLVMIGGMFSQAYKGYYNFEIGQYLFNLFGLNLIHFTLWAMLALFIQTLFDNPYFGFFILLFAPIGFIGLAEIGPQFLDLHFLQQIVFRYNQAPGEVFGLRYSDMDGYGALLAPYFIYKFYWFLAGLLLLGGALLLWVRGMPLTYKERFVLAGQRFQGRLAIGIVLLAFAFGSMGFGLYYELNISNAYYSREEKKALLKTAEKKYKKYKYIAQPKIVSVKINMDLFPKKRQFKANGEYLLINQTAQPIDTLVISYMPDLNNTYTFDQTTKIVSKDTIADLGHLDILVLESPLQAGDTMQMFFENHNKPYTLLRANDFVKSHGTFLEDDIFPRFGNWLDFIRAEHQMGHQHFHAAPTDSTALTHSFMSKDADRVDFEAIVSTNEAQFAIAPGHLQKEWTVDNRRYFHYKTDRKIALSYLFMSGDYAVLQDQWEDISLEIYYHPTHDYNIERIMAGMKAGLEYCSNNFSPYQFKQLRVVEFSQTGGATAHGFPSVIPMGEGAGFIAKIDDSERGGTDYAFGTAVHETAHEWWGHQVIPANVKGSKMVVESLAEYVNVMVKKHKKSISKARQYLKYNLKTYLQMRTRQRHEENPLMLISHDEGYAYYPKGAVVFYALSDYIGEEKLNSAIKKYVEQVAFQEKTYTTSIELVDYIHEVVPDSLQYLITDMFETVTLYDNKIVDWSSTPLDNGQYQVDIEFLASKYRSGALGKAIFSDNGIDSLQYQHTYSLPLKDYLEVGVFGADQKELYLEKTLVTGIHNKLSVIVSEEPKKVGVDPYHLLIDKDLEDGGR